MHRAQTALALLISVTLLSCGPSATPLTVRTFPPIPPQAALPKLAPDPSLFAFSEPVRGLVARIDNADTDNRQRYVIFLRLKNVGAAPLTISTASSHRGETPYHLQARIQGQWVDLPWDGVDPPGSWSYASDFAYPAPTLQLAPGESALVPLYGKIAERLDPADLIRVTLQSRDTDQWNGTLQTPARPWHLSDAAIAAHAHSLDFPTHFPPFAPGAHTPSGSPLESVYTGLYAMNFPLLQQLTLYKRDQVRAAMETRIAAYPDVPEQLLSAAQAAICSSKTGQQFIDDCCRSTDEEVLKSTFSVLEHVVFEEPTPEWAVQAITRAITDQRVVSGTSFSSAITVAELADLDALLAMRLGQAHCKSAVPTLLKLAEKQDLRAMESLGEIGDPRAIPVLLKILQDDQAKEGAFSTAAEALGKLHATEALPYLLRNPASTRATRALETFGDTRAIAALKPHVRPGVVSTASLALTYLEDPDPTMAYVTLLKDQTLDQFVRRDVLFQLGYHPDPRAIPALINAIQTDPSGAVVNNAIAILGDCYRYPDAVTGLIDCLDANFDSKSDWKRAYTPTMFRNHIAEILRHITGQSLGTNKEDWRNWWNSVGPKLP